MLGRYMRCRSLIGISSIKFSGFQAHNTQFQMLLGRRGVATTGTGWLNLVGGVSVAASSKQSMRTRAALPGPGEYKEKGGQTRAARKASNILDRLDRAHETERREIFRTSTRLYPATLLSALEEAARKQQLELALKIFELVRRQEWYESEGATFVRLMGMLGKCKRPDLAPVLLQKMVEDKCPPSVELYTALVSVYTRCDLLDKALVVYEDMKNQAGCEPDVWTYSLLIGACCESSMFDRAQELLAEMEQYGLQPNTVTYNTLINQYGKLGMFSHMEQVFEDMERKSQCPPDIWTWNSILKSYGIKGRTDKMESWFDKLCSSGMEPDVVTFNTLIKAYGRHGLYAKMQAVVAYMHKFLYPVDVVTYNLVIDAYGKAGRLEQMEEVFKRMKLRGVKPNQVTYCTLISVYGKLPDGVEMVEKILRQIRNSDVTPDVALYNSLIDAYQRFGDLVAMEDIFKEMKRSRCWPDSITYQIMIEAYRRKMMYDIADDLRAEMEAHANRTSQFF